MLVVFARDDTSILSAPRKPGRRTLVNYSTEAPKKDDQYYSRKTEEGEIVEHAYLYTVIYLGWHWVDEYIYIYTYNIHA